MKRVFIIVGAIFGLIVVRAFMLDTGQDFEWQRFWNDFFNFDAGIGRIFDFLFSATFLKVAVGAIVGGVAGFFAEKKFIAAKKE